MLDDGELVEMNECGYDTEALLQGYLPRHRIEIIFQWLKNRRPFVSEAKRDELLRRFNEITEIDLPASRITGRPSFPLYPLNDEAALKQFFEVLEWFVQEVKAT